MARVGRPLAMPVEERKEAIYEAAEKLFGERGSEVTMAEIASAAGMSKKTLYAVFADKDELLRNLVLSSYLWPDGSLDRSQGDSVMQLKKRLRDVANHVLSERHIRLFRLAVTQSMINHDLSSAFLQMGVGKSRESLVEAVRNVEKQRYRVDLTPELISGMLYGGTIGYHLTAALQSDVRPDMKDVYAAIDRVVEAMFISAANDASPQ